MVGVGRGRDGSKGRIKDMAPVETVPLKLASVVQLIDVIGVVTEPRALSIDVVGVGQGRGR